MASLSRSDLGLFLLLIRGVSGDTGGSTYRASPGFVDQRVAPLRWRGYTTPTGRVFWLATYAKRTRRATPIVTRPAMCMPFIHQCVRKSVVGIVTKNSIKSFQNFPFSKDFSYKARFYGFSPTRVLYLQYFSSLSTLIEYWSIAKTVKPSFLILLFQKKVKKCRVGVKRL